MSCDVRDVFWRISSSFVGLFPSGDPALRVQSSIGQLDRDTDRFHFLEKHLVDGEF